MSGYWIALVPIGAFGVLALAAWGLLRAWFARHDNEE